MRSYYSTVLDHPAATVWEAVRDFNGLATWFSSAVDSSEIEDGKAGDAVGAVRRFVMGDSTIRERLVAHSDADRSYTYQFAPPAPFPVENYLATLRVSSVTDGDRTFVEWWADFDCETDEQGKWQAFFAAQVFAPAIASLKGFLASPA